MHHPANAPWLPLYRSCLSISPGNGLQAVAGAYCVLYVSFCHLERMPVINAKQYRLEETVRVLEQGRGVV